VDPQELLNRGPPSTTLTAFFALNQHDEMARLYLYDEVGTYVRAIDASFYLLYSAHRRTAAFYSS
jgi:hypothetical protein